MRIENFRSEAAGDRVGVAADVTWEDHEFPRITVRYQTTREFTDAIALNANAFLLACAVPAMYRGERRVFIDAGVCPRLVEGLSLAMKCLRGWYYDDDAPGPTLDVRRSSEVGAARARRAGLFFSGGIDSLATLRANHLNYPPSYPDFVRTLLFVFGSADVGVKDPEKEMGAYNNALRNNKEIADKCGLEIIPVFTNVRQISPSIRFYMEQYHSCMLASIAHAFTNHMNRVTISSAFDIGSLKPWGTHPLLDPHYSSYHMTIAHGSASLSRLDRVRLVADWDFALQRIRSCLSNDEALLNCGKCWKCLLTETELLAAGKLHLTRAFPHDDITRDMLIGHRISCDLERDGYMDLIEALRSQGRLDLTRAVEVMLSEYQKRAARRMGKDLRGRIRSLDRRFLGGAIRKTREFIKRPRTS